MDAPNTLTAIANLALTKLGEASIASIDSTDARAVVARRVYPQVLRMVQSEFRWPELITEWAPTEYEEDLAADGSYRFALPGACLRVLEEMSGYRYRLEAGYFVTATESPNVRYLTYSESADEWSPQLVDCVVFRLAIEIAPTLTEGLKRARALEEQYEQLKKPQAWFVVSQAGQGRTYRPRRHRWARARYGYG